MLNKKLSQGLSSKQVSSSALTPLLFVGLNWIVYPQKNCQVQSWFF